MPAPTLDATPAGPSSNAYCTVAEADDWNSGKVWSSTWSSATTDQKTVAIIEATFLLDVHFEWVSWPHSTTQRLQWPRQGVIDVLYLSIIDSTTIPLRLKQATAEYARQILESDRALDYAPEAKGIDSMTVGPISMKFVDGVMPKPVPDAVRNMLPKWWGRMRGLEVTRSVMRA